MVSQQIKAYIHYCIACKIDTFILSNSFCFRLRDDKWRKQCVLGIACMVIGLQVDISDSNAIAKEISIATESSSSVSRWSDKRMCPPWRVNSLETIVPENLPRPSAHRRWEAIGFSKNAAPAVKVTVTRKARNSCFSM
ncbi:uncharacterized protein LOC111304243 [Durio zibethinus]|uniref:Uncharacterized protein LOC111304243 n=1 Tax=Durio zibethinus TaxID=66656 RepID=A0A6P5ZUM2_DURZI|nr:uncharacterized protein LOC111304243 [Durio zibethinus]